MLFAIEAGNLHDLVKMMWEYRGERFWLSDIKLLKAIRVIEVIKGSQSNRSY